MEEARFDQLRRKLLEAGVAARHAGRACQELQSHYLDLVDEALQRGASPEAARAEARQLIGTDESIVEWFGSLPELRAMPCRWPRVSFGILPAVAYIALLTLVLLVIDNLPPLHLAPASRQVYFAAMNALMGWVVPVAVSLPFAWLALRHRLHLQWPIGSIVVICILSAFVNFDLHAALPGSGPSDYCCELTMGFGLDTVNPMRWRFALTAMLVIVPLVLASRARRR